MYTDAEIRLYTALITVAVLSFVFWLVLSRVMPPTVVLSARRAALLVSITVFLGAVALVYLIPWLPLAAALTGWRHP